MPLSPALPAIRIKAEPRDASTCRFVVDRPVLPGGSVYFDSTAQAGNSAMARELLSIPGVSGVLVQDNLITVNGRLTDITGIRANMERLRAENPESALIIQAHPQARTGTIVKIRDEAYNAQMNRVNIVQSEGD